MNKFNIDDDVKFYDGENICSGIIISVEKDLGGELLYGIEYNNCSSRCIDGVMEYSIGHHIVEIVKNQSMALVEINDDEKKKLDDKLSIELGKIKNADFVR